MDGTVKLENILNRVWFVFCLVVFIYQASYIPEFIKHTSYKAQNEVTATATKIMDDLYLEKYGVTAEKYRWLNKKQGDISFPREKIQTLSIQIKIITWTKSVFLSLFKNSFLFLGTSTILFLMIRLFPLWLLRGERPSFKNDAEQFPIKFIIKIKDTLLFCKNNNGE